MNKNREINERTYKKCLSLKIFPEKLELLSKLVNLNTIMTETQAVSRRSFKAVMEECG